MPKADNTDPGKRPGTIAVSPPGLLSCLREVILDEGVDDESACGRRDGGDSIDLAGASGVDPCSASAVAFVLRCHSDHEISPLV
jgi:hypothetical protein